MSSLKTEITGSSAVPWSVDPGQSLAELRVRLRCESASVGVVRLPHPRLDEILAVDGWLREALPGWCESVGEDDPLIRAAKRQGTAASDLRQRAAGSVLHGDSYALLAMHPASLPTGRWWLLLLTRQDEPFTEREQLAAYFLLREWQVGFDRPDEPVVGRAIVGHDGRLIVADPFTQTRLLERENMLGRVLETMHPVAEQRWPNAPDREVHDFAIDLDGTVHWVLFHRDRAVDAADAEHWMLEIRPRADAEILPVGVIDDARIGRSLGYIHDQFHRSPSLTQIARAVHVSPFHFHRLFSRQVGISPKQYLQRKQLEVAKWLLLATPLPIGDLASRAGFSSHGHFTSTFHRLIGVSPSHYRERRGATDGPSDTPSD